MLNKLDSRAICFSEARKIIESRKISELEEDQKKALDYLRLMPKLNVKDYQSAEEELKQVEGLKDHQIAALLSLLPKSEDEVEVLFSKERINLKKDQVKAILDAIAKVR